MNKNKLESIFQQIEGLKGQLENDKGWFHATLIRETYHPLIDEMTEATGENCEKFKVPNSAYKVVNQNMGGGTPIYERLTTLARISMVHGHLKQLLGFSNNNQNQNTVSGVTIINQNTLAVDIKFTISKLIERAVNDEERGKLIELEEELSKSDKNWDRIKDILIWILNFSKDLFIQVVPELLKRM
jgi:hypothetical protein